MVPLAMGWATPAVAGVSLVDVAGQAKRTLRDDCWSVPLEAVAVAMTPRVRATTARMVLMVLRMGASFCGYGSPGRLSRGLVGRVGRSADVEEATEPAGAEDEHVRVRRGGHKGRDAGEQVH